MNEIDKLFLGGGYIAAVILIVGWASTMLYITVGS